MREDISSKKTKNKYGQYFTPLELAKYIVSIATTPKEASVLDPCAGKGVFIEALQEAGYQNIDAIEIDKALRKDNPYKFIKYKSYVTYAFSNKKYDLIIGNPPYIRWRNIEPCLKEELKESELWQKYCNNLSDYLFIFILKSIELLKNNGELIFICPSYWFTTTHTSSIRNYILEHGYFEKIIDLKELPIFKNAIGSLLIFKFIKLRKRKLSKELINPPIEIESFSNIADFYASETDKTRAHIYKIPHFKCDEKWSIDINNEEHSSILKNLCSKNKENFISQTQNKQKDTPKKKLNNALKDDSSLQEASYVTIFDIAKVSNGMVIGNDEAFKVSNELFNKLNQEELKHLIEVIKGKSVGPFTLGATSKYLFCEGINDEANLAKNLPHIYEHLLTFKEELLKRYHFGDSLNFWKWSFLRSYNHFLDNEHKYKDLRIVVPSKDRISKRDYFRFALCPKGIYPTQDALMVLIKTEVRESPQYICAYLNHQAIFNWFKNNGIKRGDVVEFSSKPVRAIPFRPINWENSEEVKLHDQITLKVNELITFSQKFMKDNFNNEQIEIDNLQKVLALPNSQNLIKEINQYLDLLMNG